MRFTGAHSITMHNGLLVLQEISTARPGFLAREDENWLCPIMVKQGREKIRNMKSSFSTKTCNLNFWLKIKLLNHNVTKYSQPNAKHFCIL